MNIGFWSGEVFFENLELKANAFDSLDLPLRLVHGSIRRLYVTVPWSNLGYSSVKINIEGVALLFDSNSQMNDQYEVPFIEKKGRNSSTSIEQAELLRKVAQSKESDSTFFTRLLKRIVDNIEITITDVHVRVEHVFAKHQQHLVMGLRLNAFSFHTTDSRGNKQFVDRNQEVEEHSSVEEKHFLYKMAKLVDFSLYWNPSSRISNDVLWFQITPPLSRAQMIDTLHELAYDPDHQYILAPVSFDCQFIQNDSFDFSIRPKYQIKLDIHELNVGLSADQFRQGVLVFQWTSQVFEKRLMIEKLLKARKRPLYSPSVDPRCWWTYGANTKTSRHAFAIPSMIQAGKDRRAYIKAFCQDPERRIGSHTSSLPHLTKADLGHLVWMETHFDLDVIMALRSRGESILAEEALESPQSWYSYFFQGSSSSSDDDDLHSLNIDQIQKAVDELAQQETHEHIPTESTIVQLSITCASGHVALSCTSDQKKKSNFIVLHYRGEIHATKQSNKSTCSFQLSTFDIHQDAQARFPTVCSVSSQDQVRNDLESPCLSLTLGRTQEGQYQLELYAKPFSIILDFYLMHQLKQFFQLEPEFRSQARPQTWTEVATNSMQGWINTHKAEINDMMGQRNHWNVHVDMQAPVFYIPGHVNAQELSSDDMMIVVNLGRFQFKNGTHERESYDSWMIQMQDLEVQYFSIENLATTTVVHENHDRINLVEKYSIDVHFETYMNLHEPHLMNENPQVLLRSQVPELILSFSEQDLVVLGQFQKLIVSQVHDLMLDVSSIEKHHPVSITRQPMNTSTDKNQNQGIMAQMTFSILELSVHVFAKDREKEFLCCTLERVTIAGTFTKDGKSVLTATLGDLQIEDQYHPLSSPFHVLASSCSSNNRKTTMNDDVIEIKLNWSNMENQLHVRCNEFYLQWNPSTVAILWHMLLETNQEQNKGNHDIEPNLKSLSTNISPKERIIPWTLSFQMKRFDVQFNKDEVNRPLCHASIVQLNLSLHLAQDKSDWSGTLENCIVMEKQSQNKSYFPQLLGVESASGEKHEQQKPLLGFQYTTGPSSTSTFSLQCQQLKLVYVHQQILEIWDYFCAGILGILVSSALSSATQVFLNTNPNVKLQESAGVQFHIDIDYPLVIVPANPETSALDCIQLSATHCVLVHTPDLSSLAYPVDVKTISIEHLSCTTSSKESIFSQPIQVQIHLEDIFHSHVIPHNQPLEKKGYDPLEKAQYQPRVRLFLRCHEIGFCLTKSTYDLVLAIFHENFSAEEFQIAQCSPGSELRPSQRRPLVDYQYSNARAMTTQFCLEFETVWMAIQLSPEEAMKSKKLVLSVKQFQMHMIHLLDRDPYFSLYLSECCAQLSSLEMPLFSCTESLQMEYQWTHENLKVETEDPEVKLSFEIHSCHFFILPALIIDLVNFVQVPERQRPVETPTSLNNPPPNSNVKRQIHFHATEIEFHILTDLENSASTQLICRSNFEFNMSEKTFSGQEKETQMSIQAKGMEVYLSGAERVGYTTGTDIQWFEPVEVSLQWHQQPLNGPCKSTQESMVIQISPTLTGYWSYEDHLVLEGLWITMNEDWSSGSLLSGVIPDEQLSTEFNLFGIVEHEPTHIVERAVHFDFPKFQLTLINDIDGRDMGLLQFHLTHVHGFWTGGHVPTQPWKAGLNLEATAQYFHAESSEWKTLLCRPWQLECTLTKVKPGRYSDVECFITAAEVLEILLTQDFVQTCASVMGNVNTRESSVDSTDVRLSPYILTNEVGENIRYWCNDEQQHKILETHTSVAIDAFGHQELERVLCKSDTNLSKNQQQGVSRYYSKSQCPKRLHVQVMDHDSAESTYLPIENICFDACEATKIPLLLSSSGRPSPYTLVVHSRLDKGRVHVALSCDIMFRNCCRSLSLACIANDPTWTRPIELGTLSPSSSSSSSSSLNHPSLALPFHASLGTECRIQPAGEKPLDYKWSSPMSLEHGREEAKKKKGCYQITCESRNDKRRLYFNIYSHWTSGCLRTMCISPPISVCNGLPVPLFFAFQSGNQRDQQMTHVASGNEQEMFAFNGQTSSILQFRVQLKDCHVSQWVHIATNVTVAPTLYRTSVQLKTSTTTLNAPQYVNVLLKITQSLESHTLLIQVLAEGWIINRTGLSLFYQTPMMNSVSNHRQISIRPCGTFFLEVSFLSIRH